MVDAVLERDKIERLLSTLSGCGLLNVKALCVFYGKCQFLHQLLVCLVIRNVNSIETAQRRRGGERGGMERRRGREGRGGRREWNGEMGKRDEEKSRERKGGSRIERLITCANTANRLKSLFSYQVCALGKLSALADSMRWIVNSRSPTAPVDPVVKNRHSKE